MSADRSGLTRRRLLGAAGAGGAALLVARPPFALASAPADSVVVRWNRALLEGVRASRLGPPMVARALAVAHTGMFDAWAATNGGGGGGSAPRQSGRALAEVEAAIAVAAHRTAVDLFPASAATVFDPLLGDARSEAGLAAAEAVLELRHPDGANQLGDEPGGAPGVPYSDYTGYAPRNDPMDLSVPFDPASVRDPAAWQPLVQVGATAPQTFIAPHWGHVTPFAVAPGALRPGSGPPPVGSADHAEQVREVLAISAALTDTHKAVAEYWADGPRSELPPGHWNLFAQWVARRDRHGDGLPGIERDVQLFYALTNAIFDAGCCAWDAKRVFDSVRPITAVRHAYAGRTIRAWGGPGRGPQQIDGADWLPYQPADFVTPPFGEYVSGHSAFSAAGAEILRRFTGSDRFGARVHITAGSSRVEPGIAPAHDIVLRWPTFSAAADEAGLSRLYGGIHFASGDLEGRAMGREAGRLAWERARRAW